MIECFKLLNNVYDKDVSNLLLLNSTVNPNAQTRGHTLKLYSHKHKLEVAKNFFTSRVSKAWNSLPQHVVKAPTVNTFKNRLDRFWKNQPLIHDFEASLKLYATANTTYNSDLDTEDDETTCVQEQPKVT